MDVNGGNAGASGAGPASHAAAGPVVRCILWHAPGSILPGALISALDRPTLQWKAWDCDFLTLAELCRPDVALDPLTQSARAKVVLLVEPSRLSGLAPVLDAIERFRSATPIWVFEGGSKPRLVGMSAGDVRREYVIAKAVTPPSGSPVPQPTTSPALRVVTRAVGAIVPKPIAPPPGNESANRRGSPRSPSPEPPSPPSLRLAGSDEPFRPPEDADRSESARDSRDEAGHPPEQPRDTLLSEAEIEMLLSDPPPPRNGTPKRGKHVR